MAGTFKSTVKTVTSAGTAEALVSSSTICSSVVIRAMNDNAGKVYLGDSTVSSATGALSANDAISFSGDKNTGILDLADVYVDADTGSEGVDIWYIEVGA